MNIRVFFKKYFVSDYREHVIRKLEHHTYALERIERAIYVMQHVQRKIAADKNLPPEEIEIDAVARYIPCYNINSVRELENNIHRDEEFKKNLVSFYDHMLLQL